MYDKIKKKKKMLFSRGKEKKNKIKKNKRISCVMLGTPKEHSIDKMINYNEIYPNEKDNKETCWLWIGVEGEKFTW